MSVFMRRLTTLVVILWLLAAASASADVVLKPHGQNATPLQMKRLSARVQIDRGRFATTDLDLVFRNSLHERMEADFIYTVPEGAVVTDFAYYYGEERVVARVVEKERAAAIYQYITTRMRDPALVEMIGKNRFRARIFPVMPDADLRVAIRYVQALPVQKGVATYTLPIETPRTERLEEAGITIDVKDMAGLTVHDNFGLDFKETAPGEKRLSLTAANWRTNKNLKISFDPSKSTLHETFQSARSGGENGFFALSLAPTTALAHPSVRFAGAATQDIETTRWNGGLLLTGRYHGGGRATVVVSDGGTKIGTFPVHFSTASDPGLPAVSLWASARIARLSASARNERAVIGLSKRFHMPSRWTSWLAIPRAEIERYRSEKAAAELSVVCRRLAQWIRNGRGKSRAAVTLRHRFDEICIAEKWNPAKERYRLRDGLGEVAADIAARLASEIREGRSRSQKGRRLHRQLDALCQEMGANSEEFLRDNLYPTIRGAANRVAHFIIENDENSAEGRAADRDFQRLIQAMGAKEKPYLEEALVERKSMLANVILRRIAENQDEDAEAGQARQELKRLCDRTEDAPGQIFRGVTYGFISQAATQYATEIAVHHETTATAQAALTRLNRFCREAETDPANPIDRALDLQAAPLVQRLLEQVRDDRKSDADQTRAELKRIAAFRRSPIDYAGIWGKGTAQALADAAAYRWAQEVWENEDTHSSEADRYRLQVMRLAEIALTKPEALMAEATKRVESEAYDRVPARLAKEWQKPQPDRKKIERIEKQYLDVVRRDPDQGSSPYRPRHFYYGANTPAGREAWAKDQLARIAAREEGRQIDRLLDQTPDAQTRAALLAQRKERQQKEDEIHARMGDPLITVAGYATARSVVAVMPDGEIRPFAWDAASNSWQMRFDIPTYVKEGDYTVTVIMVRADGTRKVERRIFHVDMTPPQGRAHALRLADDRLRLTVETGEGTARIAALLPSGVHVALAPNAAQPGEWFAVVAHAEGTVVGPITFILTDRAHNRTVLTTSIEEVTQ